MADDGVRGHEFPYDCDSADGYYQRKYDPHPQHWPDLSLKTTKS